MIVISAYDILEEKYYSINANSCINGIIPVEKTKKIIALSDICKIGTYGVDNRPIEGSVNLIFDTTHFNIIYFEYKANDQFDGDDSFEFLITFSDGTESIQRVIMHIKPKYLPHNYKESYFEVYNDNSIGIQNSLSVFNPTTDNMIPTTIDVSLSDSGFTIFKKSVEHNALNKTGELSFVNYDIKVKTEGEYYICITNTNSEIKGFKKFNFEFINNSKYMGDEYITFVLRDYVDVNTSVDLNCKEYLYIIYHNRKVHDKYDGLNNNLPPIDGKPLEDFKYPTIDYPIAPPSSVIPMPDVDNTEGNLLYNTKPHKEFDNYNNRTIRIGRTVPKNAVNLAYFYNTVASNKDTVSIAEADTNTVNIKYVEDWIHKSRLENNDDNNFPQTLEFNGKKGTELEGFWGILYRETVFWDKVLDVNRKPEYKIMYEQFLGLSTQKVPVTMKYDDGVKIGNLKLTHTIFTAVDFKLDKKYNYYIPRKWNCNSKYEGIIKEKKIYYNGSAKYSGTVVKKDGLTNIDPEQPKEIMVRPNIHGELFDINGNNEIDDELFYITDKFKDNVPLYFRYKLKYRIYDSEGPNKYGVYKNDSIKLVNENGLDVKYTNIKYCIDVEETQYKNIYDVFIYTSDVPKIDNYIYAIYDGIPEESYVGKEYIDNFNYKAGIKEKISPIQYMDKDDYDLINVEDTSMKNIIKLKHYNIIKDERQKIRLEYFIEANGFMSDPIRIDVVNKKDCFYSELDMFKDDNMIASFKNNNGYMTAKQMLFLFLTDEQKKTITKDTTFKTYFNLKDSPNTLYNRDKVILHTDSTGDGLVYVRTFSDTGMKDKDDFIDYLDENGLYYSDGENIFRYYSVMCRNVNQITLSTSTENNTLKGWYPKIRYSYFNKVYERIDKTIKMIYTLPEYFNQIYGKYGRPYIDVKNETPRLLNKNTILVKNTPLYIRTNSVWEPENIIVRKHIIDGTIKTLEVKSFNFKHGLIELNENISDNDVITIDYTYEEQFYNYRGYYEDQDKDRKMIHLNLNPSMYNTFIDTSSEHNEEKNTYELFNKTIYFFIRPARIIDTENNTIVKENEFTVYHTFKQEAEDPFDLHIGRIFVRHNTSLKATHIIDTRSRGGGVIEEMRDELRRSLEPDSDFYLDIGTLDGKPFQSNSVLVIRIDKRILTINGGNFSESEVEEKVRKWAAYGMFPIIEYVEIIDEKNSPQNTLKVNEYISNQYKYNPYIECYITEG